MEWHNEQVGKQKIPKIADVMYLCVRMICVNVASNQISLTNPNVSTQQRYCKI